MSQLVGVADLIGRWNRQADFTPQGARKVIRRNDFPQPHIIINRGKTKVWFLADIAAYEMLYPELTSEAAKRAKVRGYAIAQLKKERKTGSS